MAKIRTNIMEILLKKIMIGNYMYTDDGEKIRIDDINYQPLIREIYIKSGDRGFKLSMDANYDFELPFEITNKIEPDQGKLKNKNK
jgi:hypothetical protein